MMILSNHRYLILKYQKISEELVQLFIPYSPLINFYCTYPFIYKIIKL